MSFPAPARRLSMLRRALAWSPIAVMGLVACAPGVTPLPSVTPEPSPPEVVAVTPARPTRVRLPFRHDTARYDVQSVSTLTRDSAGVPIEEKVRLSAQVAFALERVDTSGSPDASDALAPRSLRATGRVDAFLIDATSRVAGASASALPGVGAGPRPPALPLTVAFDATLDGLSTRVVPRPALANECDRREMSAVALARELFVRMPIELVVGGQWADTARVFMCRGGVPVTVQSIARSVVDSLGDGPAGVATQAYITRELVTRVEGTLATTWRTVGLTGRGTGRTLVTVEVGTGMLHQLRSESTLTLDVRDSARPDDGQQTVTQRVELTADRQSISRSGMTRQR